MTPSIVNPIQTPSVGQFPPLSSRHLITPIDQKQPDFGEAPPNVELRPSESENDETIEFVGKVMSTDIGANIMSTGNKDKQ